MTSECRQIVLMAGGMGTRLRPYTSVIPKPLVPIGDISIIELVLFQLHHYGFRKVIITVGHKAEIIMAVIGNGERYRLDISYHREEKPLGTIGALPYLENLDDNFIVMNGDICTDLNFREFYQSHIQKNSLVTIGTYSRREQLELGVLSIDESRQRVVAFQEKPTMNFWVSMGINAFHKSIIEIIPKGEHFGFDNLMHKMLEKDIKIGYYHFSGIWYDIGRIDDYDEVLQDLKIDYKSYLP